MDIFDSRPPVLLTTLRTSRSKVLRGRISGQPPSQEDEIKFAVTARHASSETFVLEDAHADPRLDEVTDSWVSTADAVSRVLEFLEGEKLKFCSKGDEVCKEGVEMSLTAQVYEVRKLSVEDVRKDSKQLLVDVLGRRHESRRKVA